MAHPEIHAKSSVKKYGGKIEDYIKIHEWFDETKAWIGHSYHRMFRHHSEGIFECEKTFVLLKTGAKTIRCTLVLVLQIVIAMGILIFVLDQ